MKRAAALFVLAALILPIAAQAHPYRMHSISGVGAKAALTTAWDDGFIVLPGGERKDGQIQIKVIGGVDTVEIRWRPDNKAEKTVYTRPMLVCFGLKEDLVGDFRSSKNPYFNFQSGWIELRDGTRLSGHVATAGMTAASWIMTTVRLAGEDGKVTEYGPDKVAKFVEQIDGVNHTFESYQGVFLERLADGIIILVRNPHPTTRSTSLLSSLVETARDSLAKSAAQQTIRSEMRDADPNDLNAALQKGAQASQDAANNYQAIQSIDFSTYEKEYLLRGSPNGTYHALNKGACQKYMALVFANCPAYAKLDKNRQKDLVKWDNLVEAVNWFNGNCPAN